MLTGCIEDGYATSAAAQPEFSTDSLKMGVTFTGQPTPTSSFKVYNRNPKILSISRIALRGADGSAFRINVDGSAGREFTNIEIRPNDSIYVFVEATLPETGSGIPTAFTDRIDFITNGVERSVVVRADGCDVIRRHGYTVESDERWEAGMAYQIFDSLIVAPGAKLTLDPGVTLCFHSKAEMIVRGTLECQGTPEARVQMCGDRTDNVLTDISFDIMASQWRGLTFAPESRGNMLSHTEVRNTEQGVTADSLAEVKFLNCRLRNSAGYSLTGYHADLQLTGTEVAEASAGVLGIVGGRLEATHCTFANYYLFSALRGASIQMAHFSQETDDGSGLPYLQADINNSIVYGNGTDLSHGDFEGSKIYFRNCLLKSAGNDDDHFINILWDTDPMYGTVREDYLFDYRLYPESPAREWADQGLTTPESRKDIYGTERVRSIGAYEKAYE